ncbi:MAG: hypothetical protein JWN03_3645 [Nocardia sp.]|uniref:hypothetical protein n=1 Tax=Nocardia sp. TaxID=1821 RepID=UPI002633BFB6|nr:hypothetical protein [Nocardia sp.]MCU1643370.1 hypothetical protein [Nocardia sp.]
MATIVTGATASAQGSITSSTAYCVGTTYTVTLPAADAASVMAGLPITDNQLVLVVAPSGGSLTPIPSTAAAYVAGKDVTFQWTPTAAGNTTGLWVYPYNGQGMEYRNGSLVRYIDIVQSAPAGTTCSPSTGGTGSAGSIPVIGGLLSSLSAQK